MTVRGVRPGWSGICGHVPPGRHGPDGHHLAGGVGRGPVPAPEGVAHVVEVASDANVADTQLLAVGGERAADATGQPRPPVPSGELPLESVRTYLPGSDDFPPEAKAAAARELGAAPEAGWPGSEIARRFTPSAAAEARGWLEGRRGPGRAVVAVEGVWPLGSPDCLVRGAG